MVNADGNGAFPIQVHGLPSVVALTQCDSADIFESQYTPGIDWAQNQIFEVLSAVQPPISVDRKCDQRAGF